MNPRHQAFSAPGKVFLLGEYAVVAGKAAVVAAVGPRFELKRGGGAAGFPFAAGSPAGRLYARVLDEAGAAGVAKLSGLPIQFSDPHSGKGGFGGSTAEFVLTYKLLAETLDWPDSKNRWEAAWKLYRELTAGESLPPSGADLVAQWRGGVVLFDPEDLYCVDLWPIFDWTSVLVFSAAGLPGRKVATHEHLAALKSLGDVLVENLEEVLLAGVKGIREGNVMAFSQSLTAYADILWNSGLENAQAHADRLALSQVPDVLGVKGAGAMLSDALVVSMKLRSPHREKLIEAAQARGLVLISDGIPSEMGARVELAPPAAGGHS